MPSRHGLPGVAVGCPAPLTTSTTEQDRRRQDHETFEHGVRGPGGRADRHQLRPRPLRLRALRSPDPRGAGPQFLRDRHHRFAAADQLPAGHGGRAARHRSPRRPLRGGALRGLRRRRAGDDQPGHRSGDAGHRGVCLRDLHRPDDARAVGGHAGRRQTLAARSRQLGDERGDQYRRDRGRAHGAVSGRRLAPRLPLLRHPRRPRGDRRLAFPALGLAGRAVERGRPAPPSTNCPGRVWSGSRCSPS